MQYNLPFRTKFIKDIRTYEYPQALPFELTYDKKFHFIIQKENAAVNAIMEKAYQEGVDPTVNIGEGEFGVSIAQGFFSLFDKLVAGASVKRILDVGCGSGYLVHAFREKGFDCVGTEPGKSLCDIAKKRYNIDLLCGYLADFSFKEKFDVVYAHGVLDHVQKPYALIQEMARLLKKGGLILFSVPNQEAFLSSGDPVLMVHQHRSYFTPESAITLLKQLGFSEVGYHNSSSYAFYLYFWGKYEGKEIDCSKIADTEDSASERVISQYDKNVAIFLRKLQSLVDSSKKANKTVGLYGAISYAFGLLDWHGCFPRIFDTDKTKHGFFLPCNPNPIENPDNLKRDPVDQLWIQAHRYDKEIRNSLERIGFNGEIISYKDLLGL